MRLITLLSALAIVGCTNCSSTVDNVSTHTPKEQIVAPASPGPVAQPSDIELANAEKTKVVWLTSLDTASAESITSKRPVFMMYHSDSCSYCVHMMKTVFEDDDVAKYVNKNFVPLSLNIEKSAEARNVAAANGIKSVPTMDVVLFKEDDANVYAIGVARMIGSVPTAEDMMRALKEVKAKADEKAKQEYGQK